MARVAPHYLLALILTGLTSTAEDNRKPAAQESRDFLFEAQPKKITPGETAVLRWSIKGATKVLIEEKSESSDRLRVLGTFGGSGSLEVHPTQDTMYVLSCEGSTAYSCASATVQVRVRKR